MRFRKLRLLSPLINLRCRRNCNPVVCKFRTGVSTPIQGPQAKIGKRMINVRKLSASRWRAQDSRHSKVPGTMLSACMPYGSIKSSSDARFEFLPGTRSGSDCLGSLLSTFDPPPYFAEIHDGSKLFEKKANPAIRTTQKYKFGLNQFILEYLSRSAGLGGLQLFFPRRFHFLTEEKIARAI